MVTSVELFADDDVSIVEFPAPVFKILSVDVSERVELVVSVTKIEVAVVVFVDNDVDKDRVDFTTPSVALTEELVTEFMVV